MMKKVYMHFATIAWLQVISSTTCLADPPTAARGMDLSCLSAPAKSSTAEISEFLVKPEILLSGHADGGIGMVNAVRVLSGSSLRAVEVMVKLARTANSAQKSAIASGLARAAALCNANSPDMTEKIQEMVAQSKDDGLISAFQSASTDVQTAAVNASNGGVAAGGGAIGDDGSQLSGDNAFRYASENGIPTTSGTYDIGSVNDAPNVSPTN